MRLKAKSQKVFPLLGRLFSSLYATDIKHVIEGVLEIAVTMLEIDRVGYFREAKPKGFVFAGGYGHRLPMPGFTFEPEVELFLNDLVYTPTPGMGWDVYYHFESGEDRGLLAFDDTDLARSFSKEEREILLRIVALFLDIYKCKKQLEVKKRAALKDKKRANHDALTGLPAQRMFVAKHAELIADTKKCKTFSLLVIDLDDFKRVNDTFGHNYGNEVLKTLAEVLREFRKKRPEVVLVSRWAGEEFAVLMCAPRAVAKKIANEMRESFRKKAVLPQRGPEKRLSFSGGIASSDERRVQAMLREEKDPRNSIFQLADNRLYRAKRTGKNKIV